MKLANGKVIYSKYVMVLVRHIGTQLNFKVIIANTILKFILSFNLFKRFKMQIVYKKK
jgi:hypothetical protein